MALRYAFSPARWVAARLAGRRAPAGLAVALSGLSLRRVELPAAAAGWSTLAVRLCGICGTDVATLTGAAGPELSPFVSFPAVLGHEIVALVEQGAWAGRRVVVDPFLGCRVRGLPLCPSCAQGRAATCHRFAEGALPPGILLGYCRGLPGGWSERLLAHSTQLHAVPPGVDDEAAVLAEPFAVALHAVLPRPPARGERVLIIGAGTIGLCLLAAARLLGTAAEVVVVARRHAPADLARRLGATDVVASTDGAEGLAAAREWGAAFPGLLGVRGWTGGFDQVFDAVGSPATVAAALRLARSGGRVALVGASGTLPRLDSTPLWAHELQVAGYCGYGSEGGPDGEHTIDMALRLLAAHPELRLGDLVTHRFPLARYPEALRACFAHRRSGAVKVVFEPGPSLD